MSDEEDFSGWYHRSHPRMVVALTAFTGSRDLAHEAVAEACLRAWERWPRVSRAANIDGWVYRTACNVARRRAKRAATERRLLLLLSRVEPATQPPADADGDLWQVMRQLPARQRQVIALRYIAGLTDAQIAEILRIKRGTVSATLHTAHTHLRELLTSETRNRGQIR